MPCKFIYLMAYRFAWHIYFILCNNYNTNDRHFEYLCKMFKSLPMETLILWQTHQMEHQAFWYFGHKYEVIIEVILLLLDAVLYTYIKTTNTGQYVIGPTKDNYLCDTPIIVPSLGVHKAHNFYVWSASLYKAWILVQSCLFIRRKNN